MRGDRASQAAHHVDAGPLGVGPGRSVPATEADRALQLPQQRVHLDVRPFAAARVVARFGVVDLGLQLHQSPAVLPLRLGVQGRPQVSRDRRPRPAGASSRTVTSTPGVANSRASCLRPLLSGSRASPNGVSGSTRTVPTACPRAVRRAGRRTSLAPIGDAGRERECLGLGPQGFRLTVATACRSTASARWSRQWTSSGGEGIDLASATASR